MPKNGSENRIQEYIAPAPDGRTPALTRLAPLLSGLHKAEIIMVESQPTTTNSSVSPARPARPEGGSCEGKRFSK